MNFHLPEVVSVANIGAVPTVPLRGPWLVVARLAWLAMALLSVGTFITGIPAYYVFIQTVCERSCEWEQLTPVAAQTLLILGFTPAAYGRYMVALHLVVMLVWCSVATFIFWRKSTNPMALWVAFFLTLFGTQIPANAFPYFSGWWWVTTLMGNLGWVALNAFLYVFPDGRFVPRWTWGVVIITLLFQVPVSLPPDSPWNWVNWPPLLFATSLLMTFGLAIFAQIYRYRYVSGPEQRQQTKWVVFGLVTAIGVMLLSLILNTVFPSLNQPGSLYTLALPTTIYVAFLLVPLSIGVAILRYRLWDIDLLINRTLVYGALTASVVGVYVLIVGSLGALLQARGNLLISLLGTGLVALLFAPLRDRLQRGVNRLMYGERDDPYHVLSRLGQRLEATLAPDAVLPTIVETVSQTLKLPYVAIALTTVDRGPPTANKSTIQNPNYSEPTKWPAEAKAPPGKGTMPEVQNPDDGFEVVATSGVPVANPLRLPLVYQSELVGQLLLAPRSPDEAFSPAERRLLDDLARQAGIATHAVRLTTALQRSRERLVTAREEERRRLRNDLHDGLGPQLASLTLKLETARNRLAHDPVADALLADLTTRTQAAVTDIRRLVYALRPPALDELGLISALRQGADQYSYQEHHGLHITIEAPEELPPLPAAVEVAAFRIVQEALTNVVRHARARTCTVRLTLDELAGWLCLEVQDDGRGLPTARGTGVGLNSMRERAEELGGRGRLSQWLPAVHESMPACHYPDR